MKIRLYSDLHNEFSLFNVPVMENEHEQVLILAGDIGVAKGVDFEPTIINFLEEMSSRFKQVVYVLGNHEFYGSVMHKVYNKLYEATDHMWNVVILDESILELEDVIFVGGTLWTSLKDGDPLIMMEAKRGMNDYWIIKCLHNGNYMRLIPEITITKHYKTRDYIFHTASEHRDKKIVVVGHHAPSYRSVANHFKGSHFDMTMNYNYFSDLDEQIMDNENIVLWCHGHTHNSFDYEIGKTRVLCNPRGYISKTHNEGNKNFNKELVIEI